MRCQDEAAHSGTDYTPCSGSVARGEEQAESDVDVAVHLDPEAYVGLGRFVALEQRLIELLGRTVQLLSDIVQNVERIQGYVGELSRADFERGGRTQDAVEHCRKRIFEAAVRLGDEATALSRSVKPGTWFVSPA